MAAIVSNDGELTDLGTGEPLILPPLDERIPVPGGEVFWAPTRTQIDSLDYEHIRYQQRFTPSGPLSDLLPEPYSIEGIPLSGGSLKLHYDAEGVLYFVSGAYFGTPQTPADLRIQDPLAAISRAWRTLEDADFEMSDLGNLDGATLAQLLEFTKLKLASSGDGRTFSLIWEAPTLLADGTTLVAVLNDATQDLIHFWDPNPHSQCDPQSSNGTAATANPQNPNISDRSGLAATPRIGIGRYPFEAHWPETSGAQVQIIGLRGHSIDGCTSEPGIQYYRVAQLPKVNQVPHYGDSDTRKIVGDAVWKTKLTMDVFDELGWDGYDDQGSPARIVVEAECSEANFGNAQYRHTAATYAPVNSVVFCPKSGNTLPSGLPGQGQDYSSAASLDVVAHEWGHGVVYESAGWANNNTLHKELHEGWADVIGHSVEWRKEGLGTGPETKDWDYDEDSGRDFEFRRQVSKDDGDFSTGGGPYRYHAQDSYDSSYPHYSGLPLAVAYWLAADGQTPYGHEHLNPICQRTNPPSFVACDPEDQVTSLGTWAATRIFFRVLTVYANTTDNWNDFAEYAKRSAYDLFRSYPPCDNADDEQDTMQDAFTAIGFPGPTPSWRYCDNFHACCTF